MLPRVSSINGSLLRSSQPTDTDWQGARQLLYCPLIFVCGPPLADNHPCRSPVSGQLQMDDNMTIAQHKVVSIHYKVVDVASGETIDSSEGGAPMTYLHGAQNIIPGLEAALEGKQVGDEFEVTIEAADAYGEYSEDRVQQVPREAFTGVEQIEPGMAFTAQTAQGPINLIVTGVEEDIITVDANHPLAGKSLAFSVSVATVRDASEEELSHGHVHGEGGHHH
jgi:FKBP-type peptidyl-prolyl cis-trans isomerase SlyD